MLGEGAGRCPARCGGAPRPHRRFEAAGRPSGARRSRAACCQAPRPAVIVVDTNVIAYLFIDGAKTEQARAALLKDPEWAAPILWRSEFLSVLAGYVRQGALSTGDALALAEEAWALMDGAECVVDPERVLGLVARSSTRRMTASSWRWPRSWGCRSSPPIGRYWRRSPWSRWRWTSSEGAAALSATAPRPPGRSDAGKRRPRWRSLRWSGGRRSAPGRTLARLPAPRRRRSGPRRSA